MVKGFLSNPDKDDKHEPDLLYSGVEIGVRMAVIAAMSVSTKY